MEIPAAAAMESAMGKQNMILSTMKRNAQHAELLANIVDKSAQAASTVNSTRGTNINFRA